MSRFSIPLIGFLLLAASGVLYGVQTTRTRDPRVHQLAADRLQAAMDLPVRGWSAESVEIPGDQLHVAEATAGRSVRYTRNDPVDGESRVVEAMLLCGPHGPISVHPPTVCFTAAGYRQCSAVRRVRVADAAGRPLGTFLTTEFERPVDGLTHRIRTWWAWSADGDWGAPEHPRVTFAGVPVLHKLYLTESVASTADGSEAGQGDAISEFATQFLPLLDRVLFEDASDASPKLVAADNG